MKSTLYLSQKYQSLCHLWVERVTFERSSLKTEAGELISINFCTCIYLDLNFMIVFNFCNNSRFEIYFPIGANKMYCLLSRCNAKNRNTPWAIYEKVKYFEISHNDFDQICEQVYNCLQCTLLQIMEICGTRVKLRNTQLKSVLRWTFLGGGGLFGYSHLF